MSDVKPFFFGYFTGAGVGLTLFEAFGLPDRVVAAFAMWCFGVAAAILALVLYANRDEATNGGESTNGGGETLDRDEQGVAAVDPWLPFGGLVMVLVGAIVIETQVTALCQESALGCPFGQGGQLIIVGVALLVAVFVTVSTSLFRTRGGEV